MKEIFHLILIKFLTGGLGLKVVGFLVTVCAAVEPYVIGFFVGFGFGLAGVVLSHGDGRGFVMKFGSVVTCHGVDDQEPLIDKKNILNLLNR